MGILSDILGALIGVKEAPAPELAISEKSKTDEPLDMLFGTVPVKLTPKITFKRENKTANQVGIVVAFCVGPIVIADQQPELWVGNTPSTDPKYRFNVNTEAHSILASTTRGGGPITGTLQWQDFKDLFDYPDDMYGRGVVHTVIKYHKDPSVFERDPSHDFWLKTAKGNLRRVDGTSNGLSDSWADNPFAALQWYLDDSMVGMGFPALIGDSFADAIQWIENERVMQDGVSKKRWTVNGFISTGEEFGDVIKIFEKHCFSKVSCPRGYFEVATKGRDITPVIDFNESNIVGKFETEPVAANEAYTQVTVSFINPDKNYEKDFATYPEKGSDEHNQALEKANWIDNVKDDIHLELCVFYVEAYEHARIVYLEAKNRAVVRFKAQNIAARLIPYKPISITIPKKGWNKELYLPESIDEKHENGLKFYHIVASKYNPTIYDWSGAGQYVPVPVYQSTTEKHPAVEDLDWINNQRLLTWTPNDAHIYSIYVDGKLRADTKSASYSLNLPNGSYVVTVIGQQLFRSGHSASIDIVVSDVVFDDFALDTDDGVVSVRPPQIDNGIYEVRWNTTPDFDNAATQMPGTQFDIYSIDAQMYYVWVRYIVNDIETEWIQRTIEGVPQRDIRQAAANFTENVLADYNIEARLSEMFASLQSMQIEQDVRSTRGDSLLDYVVSEDPITGQVINRATSYADNKFTEVTFLIDSVRGEANISTQRLEATEEQITQLTSELQLVPGLINAAVENISIDLPSEVVTTTNIQSVLDANEGIAAITAQYAQFDADNTLIKANEAASFINAQEGTLQTYVTSITNAIEGQVVALADELTQAQTDINGNASAINALQLSVGNISSDLLAQILRINEVIIDANNNASAIQVLQGQVTSGDGNTNAAFNLAQQADIKADQNASSITTIQNDVADANNNATASLNLATTLDTELNYIRSNALISVQANGRLASVGLFANPTFSGLYFVGNEFRWEPTAGEPGLEVVAGKLKFSGIIDALGGIFRGEVALLGPAYMLLMKASGFGPDGLIFYYGPKFTTGSEPDYTQATRNNATFWLDSVGGSYFGGSLDPSIIINPAKTSVITLNPTLELGPFSTDGNNKQVQFAFSYNGYYEEPAGSSTPAPNPANPYADITLQRKIGSGGWVTVIGPTRINGAINVLEFNEPGAPEWSLSESLVGTFSYTDISSSTDNFMYRAIISSQSRYLSTAFIQNQSLSIISTEE